MDEGLKITNEKRHKSSSSLAGILEGVRSERKINLRASIPEVDDQFTIAEAKCNDLQQKINLVKTLRRKKKLKKRSMTTIAEPGPTSDVPVIAVHTQPKTTLLVTEMSQQSSKLRKFEGASIKNPRRYIDHDIIEQQQMLDRVRAYKQDDSPKMPKRRGNRHENVHISPVRSDFRGARAAGDTVFEHGVQSDIQNLPHEVSCGDDALYDEQHHRYVDKYLQNKEKKYYGSRPQSKQKETKYVLKETSQAGPDVQWVENTREDWHGRSSPSPRRNELSNKKGNTINTNLKETEGRPLVELFNKNRHSAEPYPRQHNLHRHTKNQKDGAYPVYEEQTTGLLEDVTSTKSKKQKTRRKYHSRRYEMPTVSSQMKQAGFRYSYSATNQANIPFVVSKSTSPSHNIGVNLQQVLNGLKVQQPLSRIPLTLAHHMGLRHVPSYGMKSASIEPILHNNEINVIKLGRRMLRLPSKYISYNRLLTLYREGDGVVPRFLRAISRPNYFYTSMYNLVSNREDFDAATSKGQVESQVAKQRLIEYANLYREYERVDKCLSEKYSPQLEARKEDLTRQLATREDYIRKVVRDYQPGSVHPLRASVSTAEETYRNSTLNLQSDIHK